MNWIKNLFCQPTFLKLKVLPVHGHIYELDLNTYYKILVKAPNGYYIQAKGNLPFFVTKDNASVI